MVPAADRASSEAIEPHAPPPASLPTACWAIDAERLSGLLHSGSGGLSSEEAGRRLAEYGPNALRESRRLSRLKVLASQLRSPLLLLLLFAAAGLGGHGRVD
jgi:Mg2+-importing ATPase